MRQRTAGLLATRIVAIADAWVAASALPGDKARYFLELLAAAWNQPAPPAQDAMAHERALHAAFPTVYTPPAQMRLVHLLSEALCEAGMTVTVHDLLPLYQSALAALPVAADPLPIFTERVGHLNQLSWEMNALRNQDEILGRAIAGTPPLVGAESSAIWLWDTDQQAPVMRVDGDGHAPISRVAPSLLALLRAACDKACAFSTDAGESDPHWPAVMRGRAVAFIPLSGPESCLGILSVHHRAGQPFTHDAIFLLSVLGSHIATAITNIRLHASERHLVGLLQSSIRQVVQAITHRQSGEGEFVESLVDVTAGLTRANLVLAYLEIGELPRIIDACAAMHAGDERPALRALGQALLAQCRQGMTPTAGALSRLALPAPSGVPDQFALAEIHAGGQIIGVLLAADAQPLAEEPQAFLATMAAQIGAGVESIEKSVDIEQMLFQLSNINYVSEAISSTFDPQRIMSLISLAASQALHAPLVICGWHNDDGAIRIFPDTVVGLAPEIAARLVLTDHNAVIRAVLDTRAAVTSRAFGPRALRAIPAFAEADVRDWLCVPMMVKGHARGVVLVAETSPRLFSSREIALVSTYANQAALAMENSLLYEKIEHQLRQMEQLYRVNRAFTATLDEAQIATELLRVSREALQAPVAMVCEADPRTGMQRLTQVLGVTVPDAATMTWDVGRGIPGIVYQFHAPVIRGNLAADGTDALLHRLAQSQGLASALAVPLALADETLGTLLVITHEMREFSTADQQLLQAIATEAASAMHNARIHREATRSSDRLREIMHVIAKNATQLLGMLTGVCEDARAADPPEQVAERARCRQAVIRAIQQRLNEDAPDHVDVRELFTALVERENVLQVPQPKTMVRATGTHCVLPVYPAALLTILLLEHLAVLLDAHHGDGAPRVTVAFNQLGHGVMLVEIEDANPDPEQYPVMINPVIIQAVRQGLQVECTDNCDGGTYRLRFRFPRPAER